MCVLEPFIIPINSECKRNKLSITVTLKNVSKNFKLKRLEMECKADQERLQDSELLQTQKWFRMMKIILNTKKEKKQMNKF